MSSQRFEQTSSRPQPDEIFDYTSMDDTLADTGLGTTLPQPDRAADFVRAQYVLRATAVPHMPYPRHIPGTMPDDLQEPDILLSDDNHDREQADDTALRALWRNPDLAQAILAARRAPDAAYPQNRHNRR